MDSLISTEGFLNSKIKIAIIYTLLISLPMAFALLYFNQDKLLIITGLEMLGLLYVVTNLLGKYAYYPSEINLIQSIALIFCVLLPPLLLLVIPVFYIKAKNNLKPILT